MEEVWGVSLESEASYRMDQKYVILQKLQKFPILGPDLKLSQTARETLAKIIVDKNITGECFPLISKNDQLLKKIGVRQVFQTSFNT